MIKCTDNPKWTTKGKTISQLIDELKSFENQELLVEISIDGGSTHRPISLVKKTNGVCLLVNSEP